MKSLWSARTYWMCQFAGWGVWTFLNAFLYTPNSSGPSLRGLLIAVWLGAGGFTASHCIRLAWKRMQSGERPALAVAFRAAGLALAGASALTVVNLLAMVYLFHSFRWSETRPMGYASSLLIWIAVLSSWQAIYFASHWAARSRRAELQTLALSLAAREASLEALRAQLNPHFLFNCLNSIRALIAVDPTRAQTAVTLLSSLLRYSLQSGDREVVTLEEELTMVDEYLSLGQIRFEERLQVVRRIDTAAKPALVPPMLLQTLVENALKHGIAKQTQGGVVTIEASLENGVLILKVMNPGQLGDGAGIGLKNARQRLALRYPERSSLLIRQDGAQVAAELRVPQ